MYSEDALATLETNRRSHAALEKICTRHPNLRTTETPMLNAQRRMIAEMAWTNEQFAEAIAEAAYRKMTCTIRRNLGAQF